MIRFWSKVIKSEGCWTWSGGHALVTGYGRFWHKGETRWAHRVFWELCHNKLIPKGMFVCHHCDNPGCVKPSHLFLGTSKDNTIDALYKGRLRNQYSVLSPKK